MKLKFWQNDWLILIVSPEKFFAPIESETIRKYRWKFSYFLLLLTTVYIEVQKSKAKVLSKTVIFPEYYRRKGFIALQQKKKTDWTNCVIIILRYMTHHDILQN